MTAYDVVLSESLKMQDSIVASATSQGDSLAYVALGLLIGGFVFTLGIGALIDNRSKTRPTTK